MSGFLLCYDIRHPRRLGRIGKAVARNAQRLQLSVYYFEGSRAELMALLATTDQIMKKTEDDLRVYPAPRRDKIMTLGALTPEGVWFLS